MISSKDKTALILNSMRTNRAEDEDGVVDEYVFNSYLGQNESLINLLNAKVIYNFNCVEQYIDTVKSILNYIREFLTDLNLNTALPFFGKDTSEFIMFNGRLYDTDMTQISGEKGKYRSNLLYLIDKGFELLEKCVYDEATARTSENIASVLREFIELLCKSLHPNTGMEILVYIVSKYNGVLNTYRNVKILAPVNIRRCLLQVIDNGSTVLLTRSEEVRQINAPSLQDSDVQAVAQWIQFDSIEDLLSDENLEEYKRQGTTSYKRRYVSLIINSILRLSPEEAAISALKPSEQSIKDGNHMITFFRKFDEIINEEIENQDLNVSTKKASLNSFLSIVDVLKMAYTFSVHYIGDKKTLESAREEYLSNAKSKEEAEKQIEKINKTIEKLTYVINKCFIDFFSNANYVSNKETIPFVLFILKTPVPQSYLASEIYSIVKSFHVKRADNNFPNNTYVDSFHRRYGKGTEISCPNRVLASTMAMLQVLDEESDVMTSAIYSQDELDLTVLSINITLARLREIFYKNLSGILTKLDRISNAFFETQEEHDEFVEGNEAFKEFEREIGNISTILEDEDISLNELISMYQRTYDYVAKFLDHRVVLCEQIASLEKNTSEMLFGDIVEIVNRVVDDLEYLKGVDEKVEKKRKALRDIFVTRFSDMGVRNSLTPLHTSFWGDVIF